MIYIETYAVLSLAKMVAIFAFLVCKIVCRENLVV